MTNSLNLEKTYQAAIRAAYAIDNSNELYFAMTQLADCYIQQDWTQTASNILAFVLLQADLAEDTHELAFELFDDLERRICPRVIWDAKAFAAEVDLAEMIAFTLLNNRQDDSC